MAAGGLGEPGLFAQGVRAVLGGWAALQLAVAQGFGGPQSPEKAAWLAGALQEFFTQNADLEEEEVEEFLAEVMDNEFDTAVEDGSLRQVSRELLTLWARRGDAGGVGEALGALSRRGPALRAALAAAHPLDGSALNLDGSAHPLDGSAQHLNGSAHPLDGSAQHLDGSAHCLDGQAPPTPLDTPLHMDTPPREESEEEAMECGTPPPPPRRLDPRAEAAPMRGGGEGGGVTPPAPPIGGGATPIRGEGARNKGPSSNLGGNWGKMCLVILFGEPPIESI